MKISYISAALAGVATALCFRSYLVTAENAKMRVEAYEFQQLTETIQPQLLAKRQQLQAQQEKLNKGSAISQSVGPAVLGDIRNIADKNNNAKLKDLLLKYGVREVGQTSGTGGEGGGAGGGAQGGAKKGGN